MILSLGASSIILQAYIAILIFTYCIRSRPVSIWVTHRKVHTHVHMHRANALQLLPASLTRDPLYSSKINKSEISKVTFISCERRASFISKRGERAVPESFCFTFIRSYRLSARVGGSCCLLPSCKSHHATFTTARVRNWTH